VIRSVPGLALIAMLFFVQAGCGGTDKPTDEEQITTALTTYYKAFGSGDSGGACHELARNTKAELEKAAGGKDCTEVLDAALERPDYAEVAPKLAGVKISAVTIADGKATAKATVPGVGKPTTIPLLKENGAWKIASPIGE
jgi:hypothetical protein